MKTYKNNYIQKYGTVILLSAAIAITSCKKSFLDVDPQGQQPAVEFWKTPEDATKAVNAIYANLRSWENVAFPALAIESLGSDEADKGVHLVTRLSCFFTIPIRLRLRKDHYRVSGLHSTRTSTFVTS